MIKIRIQFKSFEQKPLVLCFKQYQSLLLSKAQNKCRLIAAVSLPTKTRKFCVLRSPHVDKDSREQYEYRLYKKFLDLELFGDYQSLDELLSLDVPAGVLVNLKKLDDHL